MILEDFPEVHFGDNKGIGFVLLEPADEGLGEVDIHLGIVDPVSRDRQQPLAQPEQVVFTSGVPREHY